jgi:hypothetical protein
VKYHIAMAIAPNSSSMTWPTATPLVLNSRTGIIGWAAKRASTTVKTASRSRPAAPSDKRASIVELTDRGRALADQVKQVWCALAEETVTGLPAETVAELPGVLTTLTGNVDTRRPAIGGRSR